MHSNEYSVALMCSLLEGSVSGYDAWRKRESSRHSREDAFLAEKIVEAFQHNRRFPRLFYATTSLTAFSALFT
jgi:putative transposase